MFSNTEGKSGRDLIDDVVEILSRRGFGSPDKLKPVVVKIYAAHEYFDGEPVVPKSFADRIASRLITGELSA